MIIDKCFLLKIGGQLNMKLKNLKPLFTNLIHEYFKLTFKISINWHL